MDRHLRLHVKISKDEKTKFRKAASTVTNADGSKMNLSEFVRFACHHACSSFLGRRPKDAEENSRNHTNSSSDME